MFTSVARNPGASSAFSGHNLTCLCARPVMQLAECTYQLNASHAKLAQSNARGFILYYNNNNDNLIIELLAPALAFLFYSVCVSGNCLLKGAQAWPTRTFEPFNLI